MIFIIDELPNGDFVLKIDDKTYPVSRDQVKTLSIYLQYKLRKVK